MADQVRAFALFVTTRDSAPPAVPHLTHTMSSDSETGIRRWLPRSLQPAQLKRNPSLIPLLFFTAAGGLWATYYLARLALRGPDVMWNRYKNPEPWNDYENKQYKFYSTIDHSKLENPRPKF